MVKPNHQIGSSHHPWNSDGLKFCKMFTKIRLGKAMSRARMDRTPKASLGRIRLPLIHKPMAPIPRSRATDSNVEIKT